MLAAPKENSLAAKNNIMNEIVTRKDTGSIAGAIHKKHLSFYNHIRMMRGKRCSDGTNDKYDTQKTPKINADLYESKQADPIHNDDMTNSK